jgi:hypothetical protein
MFRRFLLAWRILKGFPFDNQWEIDWNDGDRQWLRGALSTHTGNKLHKLLQNEVGSTAVWAVGRNDSVRACGYAAGVAYIVGLIEAMLPQEQQNLPAENYEIETSMLDQ